MPIDRATVSLRVNGRVYEREIETRMLLADFLRAELGLKGTHIGCEHGVCGACTVLIDGRTARSCLHFAVAIARRDITTVEALEADGELSPLQEAFRRNHALQCGYCTPGFLMTVTEFLRDNPAPTEREVREALTNNVCRCTGYQNIVAAVLDAAKNMTGRATERAGEWP